MSLTPSLEDIEKHRAEQERARALGLSYAMLRDIILQANSDADDGISVGQAVELIREMGLRAVDKAVAEERGNVVAYLREYAVPRKIDPDVLVLLPPGATVVSHFADAIERGEHLRAEGESE